MTLVERLPLPKPEPRLSAPKEIAHAALLSLSLTRYDHSLYRPDYMSESFANEVADELATLGANAIVVGTRLKSTRDQQGTSYAIDLSTSEPSNIIPFPTRF